MTLPPLPDMVVIDQHIPSGYAIRGYTSKEMYEYGKQCREEVLEFAMGLIKINQQCQEIIKDLK